MIVSLLLILTVSLNIFVFAAQSTDYSVALQPLLLLLPPQLFL